MPALALALALATAPAPPSTTTASSTSTSTTTTTTPSTTASTSTEAVAAAIAARQAAERDHLRRLGLWAGASVAGGAALWWAATQETPLGPPLRTAEGFAQQSVMWGAINLTIVGLGLAFPSTTEPTRAAALAAEDDLGKILWTNIGLDAGYMMAGGVLVGVGSGAVDGDVNATLVSHGVGVATQGLGLLLLDGIAVWSSGPREEALWATPPSTSPAIGP